MADSNDPQLSVLADYESATKHRFDEEMYFISTPQTVKEAAQAAADMAGTLREYHKFGIKPLIIMEPTREDGSGNIPLKDLSSRSSKDALSALFAALKNDEKITAEEMGTLVILPEIDIPDWGNTDPTLFGKNFATIAKIYRQSFKDGKLSLMLDSTAYKTSDVNYENGDTSTAALMPYIQAIVNNSVKVDLLGFQGFAWGPNDNPKDFLNGHTAVALANKLRETNPNLAIWFNTGASSVNNNDGTKTPAARREAQLIGELAQAKIAAAAGYIVTVNEFGYVDKDNTGSIAVDWRFVIKNGKTSLLSKLLTVAKRDGIADVALFVDAS